MKAKRASAKGFTLIELVIVMAVIAILAALAMPIYTDHVRKTRTAQMKEGVMSVQSQLERVAASSNVYPATMPTAEYTADISYSYTPAKAPAGTYALTATEANTRFHIWVGVNSKGTRCACSGGSCSAPAFDDTTVACPASAPAF